MSTEHVVVPTSECYLPGGCIVSSVRCNGCLGDGRRALLDQAEAVEFRIIDGNTFAIEEDDVECWVGVES